jgi:ribosome-associated protein
MKENTLTAANTPSPQTAATTNPSVSGNSSVLATDLRRNLESSLRLARTCVRAIRDNGGQEIVVLDMTGATAMFDYFVIATGTSRRQLLAIADEIDALVKNELNDRRSHLDGGDTSRWIVLDYGTVVVHLFDDETRQFYALEALWGDVPRLDLTPGA